MKQRGGQTLLKESFLSYKLALKIPLAMLYIYIPTPSLWVSGLGSDPTLINNRGY